MNEANNVSTPNDRDVGDQPLVRAVGKWECLVCGKTIGCSGGVVASVDDGREPGTPHRWRRVGIVHEGKCEKRFDAEPYYYDPTTPTTETFACRRCRKKAVFYIEDDLTHDFQNGVEECCERECNAWVER